MRRQIELENPVAAELAGSKDAVLRALEGHLDCDLFLRGNVLTLDGEPEAVDAAAAVVHELSELIVQGHEIAPGTIEAVKRALDQHESPGAILEDVVWRHRATKVSPKTANQRRYVEAVRNHDLVRRSAPPAPASRTWRWRWRSRPCSSRREVNRIILTRPAVEAGERLGFLPGDLVEKIHPYLRPLYDALYDMLEPEKVGSLSERGRSRSRRSPTCGARALNDAFIILDEAQNTTSEQMKMFLTRLGFNSKMVVTGDITQVDLPRDQDSGLVLVADILQDVEGIEFVRFGEEDVVRHKLVRRIVAAYGEHSQRRAPELRPRAATPRG